MSDPEKLGDVLRREMPELFGLRVESPGLVVTSEDAGLWDANAEAQAEFRRLRNEVVGEADDD